MQIRFDYLSSNRFLPVYDKKKASPMVCNDHGFFNAHGHPVERVAVPLADLNAESLRSVMGMIEAAEKAGRQEAIIIIQSGLIAGPDRIGCVSLS